MEKDKLFGAWNRQKEIIDKRFQIDLMVNFAAQRNMKIKVNTRSAKRLKNPVKVQLCLYSNRKKESCWKNSGEIFVNSKDEIAHSSSCEFLDVNQINKNFRRYAVAAHTKFLYSVLYSVLCSKLFVLILANDNFHCSTIQD